MKVIGHRGAAALAPENTLASIERAFAAGADAVEIDLRLSADGDLMVIHDASTLRTTGVQSLVAEASTRALRALDAGAGFAGTAGGNPWLGKRAGIPLLGEAWEAARGRLVLEIKGEWGSGEATRVALALARFLKGRDAADAVASSFDVQALVALRDTGAAIRTGVLTAAGFDAATNIACAVEGGHAVCFIPDAAVDRQAIAQAHAAAKGVTVWTVEDAPRLQELAEWGADAVICDNPEAARDALAGDVRR